MEGDVRRLFARREQQLELELEARAATETENRDGGIATGQGSGGGARERREREREREGRRPLLAAMERVNRPAVRTRERAVARGELQAALLRTAVKPRGERQGTHPAAPAPPPPPPRRTEVVSLGRLASAGREDRKAGARQVREGSFNHFGDAVNVVVASAGEAEAAADGSWAGWEGRGTMRLGFGDADVE